MRTIEPALDDALLRRARRAIGRIGRERFHESYFTTFWLPRGAAPAHPIEEAVLALWNLAGVRCEGVEWWIGRAYTGRLPIGFHFDQDVKGRAPRHPRVSSVFFFNRVRGGHLAVCDVRPGSKEATRMEAIKPRRNRFALFRGNLLHGVLDDRGRTPRERVQGARGRLRVTLVVNFWARRPTAVPRWGESTAYAALRKRRGGHGRRAWRPGAVRR